MKIIETLWFANMDGCIGIVVSEEDVTGDRKAYIGSASGTDEKADTEQILAWGNKFSLDTALRLRHLLTEKKTAVERLYSLKADALTCGMLFGLIEKEGVQADMEDIYNQLVAIKKQVEEEAGVVKEILPGGMLKSTDRDGNTIIRPPYSFEIGGN
ncbi:hypothetical protein ES703_123973 [subsurface metagenome]